MRLTRQIPVSLLAAAALAGCGGGGGSGEEDDGGYPQEARTNFVRSCDAQPNASRDVCECALDELERTVSYAEFKAADDAIRRGDDPARKTSEKLTAAVEGCVE